MTGFIHLRVHSDYSLLEGAIGIKELVGWCKDERMPAVALADTGNLFGSLEFAQAAAAAGVQPIVAMTALFKPLHITDPRQLNTYAPEQLVLIAQNERGWNSLLALSSKAYLNPADGRAPILHYTDLERHRDGLIVLTGGLRGPIGQALAAERAEAAEAQLKTLAELFPRRLYMELSRHGIAQEQAIEARLLALALAHNIPLVATNDAYFLEEEMHEAHDAFLCIADGTYVSQDERRKVTKEQRLKTAAEMQALFSDLPEALEQTIAIAKRCSFYPKGKAPILPRFPTDGISEEMALTERAQAGLEERLERYVFTAEMDAAAREAIATPYRERLAFELSVIIKMQFPGYFLIVSDFITWSKAQGIPVGPGRGSGAGSVVAWALSITDLDPLRFGLLFERFLNPERVSMPDFDVDFCQERREEVIRYVQKKYGVDRVAQIITFGKLQARAVLRDVGRVIEMSYGQVDRISKLVPNNPANPVSLQEAIDMEPMLKAAISEDDAVARLVNIGLKLEGLNRHASTHAAGVVIGDRPLHELVPMYRDPKSDMPVVQYSMKYAEAAGLVKFDFLGLKTLTVLVRACHLLTPRGVSLDLLALPEGDPATYAMLGRGDTVGVFQLESAGMRDTLKKLKPDCIEDIIALVSLYRPGPMDNIPTYIARKHGQEKPEYLHPLLESVLKETFGVIIYQEQVMQIAQLLAGYSLGEADLLRRAMGKKIRAEMEAQRAIFVERSVARGVEKAQAASIFDLIAKFAEYGFNKSHAAAYALIAYQTAYIKANYPVAFIAASMTYDMHNTDKLGVFREEAGRFGIKLLPPDINISEVLFSVEGESVRYALAAIRNVGAQAMEAVVAERTRGGVYKDIFDFVQRVPLEALNRRALEYLIKAGAFDALHTNRHQLIANLDTIFAYGTALQRDRGSNQESLFASASMPSMNLPKLKEAPVWPQLEALDHEFSAIGFYLSAHPLGGYESALKKLGVTTSSMLPGRLDSQYKSVKVAGIVTGSKFKVSDRGRFAFVQLSDLSGIYEVSIFNELLINQHREKLAAGTLLLISADGKLDDSGPRLIAQSISSLDDALKNQKHAQATRYRISIDDTSVVADLRKMLGQGNGSGAQVILEAKIGHEAARIVLPDKYPLTPSLVDQIRVMKGVERVEELDA